MYEVRLERSRLPNTLYLYAWSKFELGGIENFLNLPRAVLIENEKKLKLGMCNKAGLHMVSFILII